MKKKTVITFLAGLLFVGGLEAQSIQEGKNHLYSDRYKSAIATFEKLLALNPNNIEATYWLGQTYLEMDEIAGARVANTRQLYEKALQSSANAPLLLVGLGHVELRENKLSEARQRFETALTMTRGRKGDDPAILIAVGRANAEAKSGDYNYAIEKLLAAADKGDKTPDVFLQLGNAYRKAKPGEGGGDAYKSYKKALEMDPSFAIADLRLAKLFESQKNWDLFTEYLNSAIKRNPNYTPAFYELFYYNFFRAKFPEAEVQLKKYIDSKLPEKDIQDEYLYAQLGWARKDFGSAIIKAESVVTAMGNLTKPKVYRLLADAYYQKGDTLRKSGDSINGRINYISAKKYSDEFFAKKNPDDIILPDYEVKASILGRLGGNEEEVYTTYLQGAALDTTIEAKVNFLKKGASYFKDNKQRIGESKMLEKLIELKPKPTINDYFDLTLAYYFGNNYSKSRGMSLTIIEKFPEQVYGYEWAFNNARIVDTVKKDSIAVPDALKLYEFSEKDTAKFKKQYISSTSFLAIYYANDAKNKAKAVEFLKKWQMVDVVNAESIQKNIDILEKTPARTGAGVTPKGNPAPTKSTINKSRPAKSISKTTTSKTVVVKK